MKKILLALLFFSQLIPAQTTIDLDSVFNAYINYRNGALPEINHPKGQNGKQKCGLPSVAPLVLHFRQLSTEQQTIFSTLAERPVRDTSIVSPKGKFRLHFNLSGYEKPAYPPDSLAAALDSVWEYEVNFLGYPQPPSDGDAGGDALYDVYIVASQFWYGETVPESRIEQGADRFTSYMKIDNDFAGFYTTGLPAAKVTAAHEFHHAIQMGNYILRYTDSFFHELTSTSMEEFVFPEINDYIGYIDEYFDEPWRSFSKYSGYNLATWNFMLSERFGIDIIKKQWNLMPTERALKAIANTIRQEGSEPEIELNTFGVWNYFTNYRAQPGKYFRDAGLFPEIKSSVRAGLVGNNASASVAAHPVSNNQITIWNNQQGFNDTLVTIITDFSLAEWEDSPDKNLNYGYTLYNYNESGSTQIAGSYYDKITGQANQQWKAAIILNNQPVERGGGNDQFSEQPYPAPFVYGKTSEDVIYFPFKFLKDNEADLQIYSAGGDLVYGGSHPLLGCYETESNGA